MFIGTFTLPSSDKSFVKLNTKSLFEETNNKVILFNTDRNMILITNITKLFTCIRQVFVQR